MEIFSNQKQVALTGMVSSCQNRFKSTLRFPDLIICKFDDDLINIKAVFSEKNVSTLSPTYSRDNDRSADTVSPMTLKIGQSSQKVDHFLSLAS